MAKCYHACIHFITEPESKTAFQCINLMCILKVWYVCVCVSVPFQVFKLISHL